MDHNGVGVALVIRPSSIGYECIKMPETISLHDIALRIGKNADIQCLVDKRNEFRGYVDKKATVKNEKGTIIAEMLLDCDTLEIFGSIVFLKASKPGDHGCSQPIDLETLRIIEQNTQHLFL